MMKGRQGTSTFDIPCSVFDILIARGGITPGAQTCTVKQPVGLASDLWKSIKASFTLAQCHHHFCSGRGCFICR